MATLRELAKYVRTKNAGPFWATIDIFCKDAQSYERVSASQSFTVQTIADVYHTEAGKIKTFAVDSLHVVKFSFPRSHPQGDKYENDMHFGQQYVFLLDAPVD